MRVIVTGGAGFIGSHLVDAYMSRGDEVLVIDNLSTGSKDNIGSSAAKCIFHPVDIRSVECREIIKNFSPDLISHHAGQRSLSYSQKFPAQDAEINVLGTLNILEAARQTQCRKFIFSSTAGAIYANENATEEDLANPRSPYGVSKLSCEFYLRYYSQIFNFNVGVLRYSNVIGPRQDAGSEGGVVAIFARAIREKKDLPIFGDGNQCRDFIGVKEVVDANIKIERNLAGFELLNVSSGVATSINELVRLFELATGQKIRTQVFPNISPGVARSVISSRKLQRIAEWVPGESLNATLRETISWIKNKRPE